MSKDEELKREIAFEVAEAKAGTLVNPYNKGIITIEQAAEELEISEDEFWSLVVKCS